MHILIDKYLTCRYRPQILAVVPYALGEDLALSSSFNIREVGQSVLVDAWSTRPEPVAFARYILYTQLSRIEHSV